jgi:ribose-phosphate pyrophosphokinase
MKLSLIGGTASAALADRVAGILNLELTPVRAERFPDGELHIELLDTVRGADVFILQSTGAPTEPSIFELLLTADACRRAGATRRTAVIPYFGYARQDRRARGREAVGARLVADLLQASGVTRIVGLDVHTPAIEALTSVPFEHLTAVPALIEAVRTHCDEKAIVVAPDLGAARLADRFAQELDLPVAVVHKTRISGAEVRVSRVTGDVAGRWPLIVDDMISTGATIQAAHRALAAAGSQPGGILVATHGLFVADAADRLRGLNVRRVIVTDSVPASALPMPANIVSLAEMLADVIRRLNEDRSLAGLLARR